MQTFLKNIRFKVSFFVLVLIVFTTFVFYLIAVQIMNQHILNEVIKRAEGLSRSIAASAGYNFLSKDLLGLDNLVFKIKDSNPDVEYIAIVDTANKALVHSDINKNGEILKQADGPLFKNSKDGTVIKESHNYHGPIFEIFSPIVFMDKHLGSVILGINKSVLLNAQHTARKRILWIFLVTLFLGLLGSIVLSSYLTRPIEELSSGVDELKKGIRSRPLTIYSQDELGRLTKSFNEMSNLISGQREKLSEAARDLEESYHSTVKVLAAAIDARDPYTHGHSSRVSQLSLKLGKKLGLSLEELGDLEIACLFHDVGKIKIPDSILRKNGKLDSSEYSEMMRHTEYGADILSKAPSLHKYIPSVKHHHEAYNGAGYPDKLSGNKIPLFAAIMAIADAFDALTSTRPYRDARPEQEALTELINSSGEKYNPELMKHFVEIIKENSISSTVNSQTEMT